jgi:hypothetical protein
LRSSTTCAGLKIADYAASLGRSYYTLYRSVYARDSQRVHQRDSLSYVEIDDAVPSVSPRWYTSPHHVRETLDIASLLFVSCMEQLNKRLRFGQHATDRIGEFVDELGSPGHDGQDK